MHVDQHPRAVDVADLQVQPFPEPQPQRVDRPEKGPVVVRADGADETPHFVDREHVGESLVPTDAEPLERRPVTGRGVGIEELDAARGDSQRRGGEFPIVLEMEEIVADLLLAESVGRGVEVSGELPDGAEVGLLGTLAQSGQLEVLAHPLVECRGHLKVLSQRSEETPLRRTLCHGPAARQGFVERRKTQ
jgi:hypothetical protein